MTQKKILTIDDDETFSHAIKRVVTRLGHAPYNAGTLALAMEMTRKTAFDLILLDVGLPDGNGLDHLSTLRDGPGRPEVVIITGAGDAHGAELAILNGAWDYIEKTASTKNISLAVNRALQYREEREKSRDRNHIRSLKRDAIIGASPLMAHALDQAARAAACDAHVLITGETGTGKELFASAIHANSDRSSREMVVVDCAALPETLAENLLFGHVKGSYTGADRHTQGLIGLAHQATLFLDEIGELSLPLQKTLLRVLQEKKFRPIGGQEEQESRFRLICATNRDLDQEVKEGRFRTDLLFRIRSLHIDLPPLRNRDTDLHTLTRHYLDLHSRRQGVDYKGVSSDFFDVLSAYSWPGNVRELSHTMEHAVISALKEPTVFPTHLPRQIRIQAVTSGLGPGPAQDQTAPLEQVRPGTIPTAATTWAEFNPLPPLARFREMVLARHEKKYLEQLMAQTDNIKEACALSGLSRSRLYALLKKHQE